MTMLASIDLSISYSTLGVWDPSIHDGLFLDFSKQHFNQGFAWRCGQTDFHTVSECISAYIEVHLANEIILESDTVRAIQVPFTVRKSGIVVNSPSDEEGKRILVPEGNYKLVFEMKPRNDEEYLNSLQYQEDSEASYVAVWVRLTFIPSEQVEPMILRADEELSPTYPLLMEAETA